MAKNQRDQARGGESDPRAPAVDGGINGSNSQSAVESLVASCNEFLQRGKQGGQASLEAFRDAGAALFELKELLPRGEFGRVANERCRCSKQWRARLMQLSQEWDEFLAALRWAEADAPELLRKAYSVDGALALLKVWRRAENGDAGPKAAPRAPRPGSEDREIAHLKGMLNAGVRFIAVLEEELAARTGTPNGERLDIGAADRSKIQKVATLWLRPGTDGEGSAAAHRLRALARRLGWPIRDLLHACKIESPADWTFTSTP
jgi:hypothetical protein